MGFGIDEDFDEADFYCKECQRYVCECEEEIETGEKMTDAENIERAPKAFVDPKTTAQKSLVAMSTQNFELYDKCLNEPGFAYHFGQIVNRAFHYEHLKDQNADRANPDPRVAELVKLLREHHNWHLEFTEVPESFVGLNLAAEYCDSDMYERTVSVLDKFERGGT